MPDLRAIEDLRVSFAAEGDSILFEGRDLRELDDWAMRRIRGGAMGMTFQDPLSSLNPVDTVGLLASLSAAHAFLHSFGFARKYRSSCEIISNAASAMLSRSPH